MGDTDTSFPEEALKKILEAARAGQWKVAEAWVSTLADFTVAAIANKDPALLRAAYLALQEAYRELGSPSLEEVSSLAHEIRCALRTVSAACRMRTVLERHREQQQEPGKVSPDPARTSIVNLLKRKPAGLTNKELAEHLHISQEQVARVLPQLRATGEVQSLRTGKSILNYVQPQREPVVPESLSNQRLNDRVVKLDDKKIG